MIKDISKDVINDLLPVYLAGEASGDTRDLVEDYLRSDSELAASVKAQAAKSAALFDSLGTAPAPDHEKATFERIRSHVGARNRLFAFAMLFALLPFSTSFSNGQVTWVMLRDNPTQAGVLWVASGVCWIVRAVLLRRRSIP
jgi:anti-sigma factor RsiW